MLGRSGAFNSGITTSVGPMRRPVSAPKASGLIDSACNSSQFSSGTGAGLAPIIGSMPGEKENAT
jgi:hypothetical protein